MSNRKATDNALTTQQMKLYALADFLETLPPERFRMDGYWFDFRSCRTAGCIAGWTVARFTDEDPEANQVEVFARRYLELDDETAGRLFAPAHHKAHGSVVDACYLCDNISTAHAARVIRHLADTGDVDWSISDSR